MGSTQATATKNKKTSVKTESQKPARNSPKKKPDKARVQDKTKILPEKVKSAARGKKGREKLEETRAITAAERGIDLCKVKLSAKRHDFLLNYLTPGSPCFHNALQAARKAGYSEETAKGTIYRLLREPEIQRIVAANEGLAQQSLREAAKKAIEIKKRRAFFDPLDYFQEKEIVIEGKDGAYSKTVMGLKDMNDMTELQRMCIDGVDIKGQASIPVYLMPDRAKELNEIIKMDAELSKSIASTGEEETREIIIERITLREAKRAKQPSEMEYEIIENPVEGEDDNEEDEDDV
jgi:hypothetical protein